MNVLKVSIFYLLLTAPSQQPPPEYELIGATTLRIYWGVPDYPNGIIEAYYLYRDDVKIATVDVNGKLWSVLVKLARSYLTELETSLSQHWPYLYLIL